jgi:hypothetical protein
VLLNRGMVPTRGVKTPTCRQKISTGVDLGTSPLGSGFYLSTRRIWTQR